MTKVTVLTKALVLEIMEIRYLPSPRDNITVLVLDADTAVEMSLSSSFVRCGCEDTITVSPSLPGGDVG